MSKQVDILIFTDMGEPVFIRAVGAYRMATELRDAGYIVQVVDHLSFFSAFDFDFIDRCLNTFVGSRTLMVGFSTTFMNPLWKNENVIKQTLKQTKQRRDFRGGQMLHGLPLDIQQQDRVFSKIRQLNPKCKIVIGGSKSEMQAVHGADAFIIGYGELETLDYLKWLQGKNPFFQYKTNAKGAVIVDSNFKGDGFDYPNCQTVWDDSDCVEQGEVLPIEISRGCIFRCKFCAYPLNGKKKNDYLREPEVLYTEFMRNYDKYGTTYYVFPDDTFNETTKKLQGFKSVTDRLPFKIKYSTYARHDLIYNFPEQAELLLETGLVSVTFGLETMNYESAKAIGKGLHPEKAKELLYNLKEDKWKDEVMVASGFIFGLPYDTPETMTRWLNELLDFRFPMDAMYFNTLHINPNSPKKFKSEFELEFEKYGYRFDPREPFWFNDVSGTSYDYCNNLAREAHIYSIFSGRNKRGGFFTLPMVTVNNVLLHKVQRSSILNSPLNVLIENRKLQVARYKAALLTRMTS